MLEDIGTLRCRTIIELRLEGYILLLVVFQLNLLQLATCRQEEILHLLVRKQCATTYILQQQLRGALLQILLPKVIALLKGRAIVEFIPLLAQHRISQTRGVSSQADHPILSIRQVKLQRLNWLIGFLLLFILFIRFLLLIRFLVIL